MRSLPAPPFGTEPGVTTPTTLDTERRGEGIGLEPPAAPFNHEGLGHRRLPVLDVGVDLDGCAYPFVEVLRDWIHLDANRSFASLPSPTCWHFYDEQWGFGRDDFYRHLTRGVRAGVIFRSGSPIRGSVQALHQIADAGHRIHIVTARVAPGAEAVVAESTRWWLAKHDVPYTSLTISVDKTVVDTDVFVDDSPANYAALEAAGSNPWFFHRPWNASVPGRRVRTWPQFRGVVEDLALHLNGRTEPAAKKRRFFEAPCIGMARKKGGPTGEAA